MPGDREVLGTVLDPLHGPAEEAARDGDRDVLRPDEALLAERTADVAVDHRDEVDRHLQEAREREARHRDALPGRVVGEPATRGVEVRDAAASLHRDVGLARLHEPLPDHPRCACERGVGVAVDVVLTPGDIAAEVVPDRRARLVERLFHRADRRQLLVVHLDQLAGVLGGGAARGDDDRDRVADQPHLVGGQRRLRWAVDGLRADELERQRALRHLGAGEHEGDARRAASRDRLHTEDASVRERAAQERGVQHPGELQVVHVAAAAGQDARVLHAGDASADETFHHATPVSAIRPPRSRP